MLGILSSADCLGCTLAKGAAAAGVEEGVDVAGAETGALVVAGVTSIVGVAAGTATGAVEVVGVASTELGCSEAGALPVVAGALLPVGTNAGAVGFSEDELGLTEATAVGAAIWRIAGTAAVRGWVVRIVLGLIGSTRCNVG